MLRECFFLFLFLGMSLIFLLFWGELRNEEMVATLKKGFDFTIQRDSSYLRQLISVFSYVGMNEFFIFFLFPLLFWTAKKKAGIRAAMVLLVTGFITWVIREITALPRPMVAQADGLYSFPSGHVTQFIVVAGYLAVYFKNKTLWFLVGAFTLIIGVSRIFFGFHFLDDIIGSFLVGIASLYFFIKILRWVEKKVTHPELLFFYLFVLGLPFFFLLREELGTHLFLLIYLLGLFTGYVLENYCLNLNPPEGIIQKSIVFFSGFCFLITVSSITIVHYSQYSVLNYFGLGIFTSLLWPLISPAIQALYRRLDEIK